MPRCQPVQPTRPNDACFNLGSWVVLGLALLIVALSLAQTLIRLALPSEGWSFVRDITGIHPQLIFDRSLNQLADDLLEVVEEAMQPTFVSLWLCNASGCPHAIDSTKRWSDPAELASADRSSRPMQREVSEVERSLAGAASHPAFRS